MEPGISSLHTSPGSKDPRRKRRLDQQFAVFDIEGSLFRERRYGFEKWSNCPFPEMFAIPEDDQAKGEVGSEKNPIRLSGLCTAAEFESLLEVMYSTDEPAAMLDKDEWIGVLKLARLWNMPQLAAMAVDKLGPDLSPMEKITLGKASVHRVAQWIREGYTAVIGDLNTMTLEGLAADVGWERTARVLWAFKKASFKYQPSLVNLSTVDVVNEILEEEFPGEGLAKAEAGLHSTYLTVILSSARITITQEQPVPRRAGTASMISFFDDGVYVSRNYAQPPTCVLQDFGFSAGWHVEKHVRLVGDTTGRGLSDIIGFGNAGVYVSRNNGDSTFGPAKLVLDDLGYNSEWRVDKHLRYVVDLRKKGFVDIIGFGDGGVYVALNNGNGSFGSPKIVLPDFGYDAGGWRLERHLRFLADTTGNGLPDIIGFGEDAVYVALNNGDGTFQNSKVAIESFTPGAGGWSIEKHPRTVSDLTGDGRVDIVGFFDDGVRVALNAGDGTFHPQKLVVEGFGYYKACWRVGQHPRFVADLTGDGCSDIVGFGGVHFSFAMNKGEGTFKELTTPVYALLDSCGWPRGTCSWHLVDLTGKGAVDVIAFEGGTIWVSYNDEKGNFGAVQKLRQYRRAPLDKTIHWFTNLYA